MKGAVYVNGTIAPANQAVVPVYDHGFLYGEGVYETLRTYNRVPFLFDRHTRRCARQPIIFISTCRSTDATLARQIDETAAAFRSKRASLPPVKPTSACCSRAASAS